MNVVDALGSGGARDAMSAGDAVGVMGAVSASAAVQTTGAIAQVDGSTKTSPDRVLGVSLVLALVLLLLAIPLLFLALGAARRIVRRMSRPRKPIDRRVRREGWAQAGERAQTPTAEELESQHGGDGGGDGGGGGGAAQKERP